MGRESEILSSLRHTVLAVSHRRHPELSQALRISQGECSTSQVARNSTNNNIHYRMPQQGGRLTNMANVTLTTPTCSDTSCVAVEKCLGGWPEPMGRCVSKSTPDTLCTPLA